MKPQIILESTGGHHNNNLEAEIVRLDKANSYRDLSTVCLIATRGTIHAKVLGSWFGMITPMNQKFIRMFACGLEVAKAYNQMIKAVLDHPMLGTWRYILTLEEDNLPPPDGLLRLYESVDDYDVIGGLYWTKGESGQPMVYGDPADAEANFRPQIPKVDTVQPARGLGMGFNLFKMDMFRDEKLQQPWFKTREEYIPGQGTSLYTQDLYFYEHAGLAGYKFACDTRVKVGHYDAENDVIW